MQFFLKCVIANREVIEKPSLLGLARFKFKLFQISTWELLRSEIKNKSELGINMSTIMNSGQLVSDEIVGNLIKKFVSNIKYKMLN